MKKLIKIGMVLLFSALLVACSGKKDDKVKIGIVQIVQHPSLDTIHQSIVEQLEKDGYKDGSTATIYYKNAGGDQSTLSSIIDQFKNDKVDVIIAIATPSAQASLKVSKEIPVVFAAVSDPIGAGLLKDLNKPDLNVTGTSDEIQVAKILDLAIEMYPETKKVGFLYNSSEANSISNLEKVKAYTKANNLTLVEASVSSTNDIQQVSESLTSKVDIIFTPNDNMIASAMSVLSNVTKKSKTPLFVGADSMVKDGGLATIGIDYPELGFASAKMAVQILRGEDVKNIPVKIFNEDLNVYYNESIAKEIGFEGFTKLQEKHDKIEIIK